MFLQQFPFHLLILFPCFIPFFLHNKSDKIYLFLFGWCWPWQRSVTALTSGVKRCHILTIYTVLISNCHSVYWEKELGKGTSQDKGYFQSKIHFVLATMAVTTDARLIINAYISLLNKQKTMSVWGKMRKQEKLSILVSAETAKSISPFHLHRLGSVILAEILLWRCVLVPKGTASTCYEPASSSKSTTFMRGLLKGD